MLLCRYIVVIHLCIVVCTSLLQLPLMLSSYLLLGFTSSYHSSGTDHFILSQYVLNDLLPKKLLGFAIPYHSYGTDHLVLLQYVKNNLSHQKVHRLIAQNDCVLSVLIILKVPITMSCYNTF